MQFAIGNGPRKSRDFVHHALERPLHIHEGTGKHADLIEPIDFELDTHVPLADGPGRFGNLSQGLRYVVPCEPPDGHR